jgi:hypothetical protein
MADMHEDGGNCDELINKTAALLSDDRLRQPFGPMRQDNVDQPEEAERLTDRADQPPQTSPVTTSDILNQCPRYDPPRVQMICAYCRP